MVEITHPVACNLYYNYLKQLLRGEYPLSRVFPLTLIVIFSHCSLVSEFEYSSETDLIVINGLITPDSIIKVSITKSGSFPGIHSYPVIENASVDVYEGHDHIGELDFNEKTSLYQLNEYPKAGHTYRLEVLVGGYPLITATTQIPKEVSASACFSKKEGEDKRFNNKANVSITIKNEHNPQPLWLNFTEKVYETVPIDSFPFSKIDSSSIIIEPIWSLYSESPFLDGFNGTYDDGLNNYTLYLRMNDPDIANITSLEVFSLESAFIYDRLVNLSDSLGFYLDVFRPSEDLDKYWKSTFINYLNSELNKDIPNPFTVDVASYSNISNGTGIFAGYTLLKIPIHQNLCE